VDRANVMLLNGLKKDCSSTIKNIEELSLKFFLELCNRNR
jgi:hypothetical protein